MKGNNRPLVQRFTRNLANTAQQLLQQYMQTPAQPDRPTTGTGLMPDLSTDAAAPGRARQSFANEMFAELLIELPDYQEKISLAYRTGDRQGLRDHVHRLLGAVAYCEAPELESALRTLHSSLATDDKDHIDSAYVQARSAIDNALTYSGHYGSV